MLKFEYKSLSATFEGVQRVDRVAQFSTIESSEYTCSAFFGVLLSDRRLVADTQGEIPEGLTIEEAMHANGEWLAIFSHKLRDEYLVLTDGFAFQTVFYALVGEGRERDLVVASTPQAVAAERNARGQHIDPDWAQIASLLSTNDSWSSTLNSDRTPDKNIQMMRPFEMMLIQGESSMIVPRSDFVEYKTKSYEELIEAGAANAIGQLQQLGAMPFAQRRINQSGGKDSRVMMALLVAAGMTDKYVVRSVNPTTWGDRAARKGLEKDLLIADSLRRRYGMEWAEEPSYHVDYVTPFESLDNWQHFNSSLNYRFPIDRRWVVREPMFAELRGASGECFREFWSYYWTRHDAFDKLENTPESFERDAKLLFEEVFDSSLLTEELQEQLLEYFVESLRNTGFNDILEAGDRHFSLYRNRGHFGTTLRFAQDGSLPFFPLNQSSWVRAGEKVDRHSRVNGAVFFDIIEHLAPELNDLPFDSKQWTEDIWRRRTHSNVAEWEISQSLDAVPEYFANENANGDSLQEAVVASKRPQLVFGDKSFAVNQIRLLIDELRELSGAEVFFTPALESRLLTTPEWSIPYARFIVSKLTSVRDVVIGAEATQRVAVRRVRKNTMVAIKALSRVPSPVPDSFRRETDGLLYRVQVCRDSNSIVGEALIDHVSGYDIEFAFYLRTGTKVDSIINYSSSRTFEFDCPEDGKDYHVQAFARFKSRPSQTFVLQSARLK